MTSETVRKLLVAGAAIAAVSLAACQKKEEAATPAADATTAPAADATTAPATPPAADASTATPPAADASKPAEGAMAPAAAPAPAEPAKK